MGSNGIKGIVRKNKLIHFLVSKVFEAVYILNSDCFVVSYPKSGRTWLRVMLGKYFELAYGTKFTTELQKIKKPVRIKFSHDKQILRFVGKRKCIVLTRDPKDVIVSFFYHERFRRERFNKDISSFIRDKKYGIKNTVDYQKDLLRLAPKKCLHIKYEDMVKDTFLELRKVIKYLGLKVDESLIKETVDFAQFKNLQKKEKEDKITGMAKTLNKDNINSFRFRKGKIGNYKELDIKDVRYLESFTCQQ